MSNAKLGSLDSQSFQIKNTQSFNEANIDSGLAAANNKNIRSLSFKNSNFGEVSNGMSSA